MAKYRKNPVVIEAFQLNERGLVGEDWFWDAVSSNEIITHDFGKYHLEPAWCEIKTLEGTMVAKAGDYIIRGVNGEIYPCKPDIFEKTYEYIGKDSTDKMSNADRIRSMTDEELEEFISKVTRTCIVDALGEDTQCDYEDVNCTECKAKFCGIQKWLQSEVEE